MFNLKKIIIGITIVIAIIILINIAYRQKNQVVMPDLSGDKNAKEMGSHILSSNPWFTCPDKNVIADWMRNFIDSGEIGTGSNFTEEHYITLFENNPLYWSCLVVNGEDYISEFTSER